MMTSNDLKFDLSNAKIEDKKYIGEFWTSKQRNASSIHEISYRACFKPQLPKFFIDRLTEKGDVVYDPFGGRGTTIIESCLNGRYGISNDINPLSEILSYPRVHIPSMNEIEKRLNDLDFDKSLKSDIDLSMFYHKDTLGEIVSLRNELNDSDVDKWIRMVATNRLTGHSKGFFSVYTLPPNQSVSAERQIKLNEKSGCIPEYRDVKKLILKKSKQLIFKLTVDDIKRLNEYGEKSVFLHNDARNTPEIKDDIVKLVVTSPPFLNIVQYNNDNWLRNWFNEIGECAITMSKTVEEWSIVMKDVLKELHRIVKSNGWVAFEVGEVKNVNLDEVVVPLGESVGFEYFGTLINQQNFTKTSNLWGVKNNTKGTNSNRIVILKKSRS